MKSLRWPTSKEQSAYMRMRKDQNLINCQDSKAEAWMKKKLNGTGIKWSRQATWGYRIFDFWSHFLGCVVEADGIEHDPDYDNYRDEYVFRRSGIVAIRVDNFNEEKASKAIEIIGKLGCHQERKKVLGLYDLMRRNKGPMAPLPYFSDHRLSASYISGLLENDANSLNNEIKFLISEESKTTLFPE